MAKQTRYWYLVTSFFPPERAQYAIISPCLVVNEIACFAKLFNSSANLFDKWWAVNPNTPWCNNIGNCSKELLMNTIAPCSIGKFMTVFPLETCHKRDCVWRRKAKSRIRRRLSRLDSPSGKFPTESTSQNNDEPKPKKRKSKLSKERKPRQR